MKKFISMVMAAAMVVSLVPATAFAGGDDIKATAKVVNAWDKAKDYMSDNLVVANPNAPEIQVKINNTDFQGTDAGKVVEFKVSIDNANFASETALEDTIRVTSNGDAGADVVSGTDYYLYKEATEDQIKAELAKVFDGGTARTDLKKIDPTAATLDGTATSPQGSAVDNLKKDLAPINGEDKATNEQTAFEAYATDTTANGGLNLAADVAAKYRRVDASNPYGEEGWLYLAGTPDFVPYTDVLAYAVKKAGAAGAVVDADGHEVVANGAIVSTKTTKEAWVNAAYAAFVATVTGTDKIYVETKKTVGAQEPTGRYRKFATEITEWNKDEVTVKVTCTNGVLEVGDIISMDLLSTLKKAKDATVAVESDDITISNEKTDMVYVNVEGEGIKVSTKKTVNIAEEEKMNLTDKGIVIEPTVDDSYAKGDKVTLKLSKGFEFAKDVEDNVYVNGVNVTAEREDDNEISFLATTNEKMTVTSRNNNNETVGLEIESTSAKSGAVATMKVTVEGAGSASVEVAKVVDYKVLLSVDEDEDVPVIYSGVNVGNDGITDDSDHLSLEVTAEESFPGAWSMRKGFNFELPEGVHVTNVDVTEAEYFYKNGQDNEVDPIDVEKAFYDAYQDGDHLNFEFEKRVFDDVDSNLRDKECATMTFQLELVADPTFEGDVVLKLTGDLVDEQEVTIAKFVKPYTVKAEQNDMKIDYRYTDIPTAITITEAEAGLWEKGAEFTFKIDKGDYIEFEDDATFEIDKDSELEIKDTTAKGTLSFTVKAESDEAATVTIKDMQLFMQRNIPAGPYDLTIFSSLEKAFLEQGLFAPDEANCTYGEKGSHDDDKECYVDDIDDYSDVVKAAFVNVITSGRDKDDASFTTKVVVPVGESYIIAGENQVALDVPAYVSAAGYTMLPVRAVAVALGIDTQNVLWNQPTRTVTILYGQRIITMTAGQKVVYVNGSAIPASASVEITNGRTFLPMRDLATALGVTDITWDAATKTATLNGSK